jgi:hypothetical protein
LPHRNDPYMLWDIKISNAFTISIALVSNFWNNSSL